jgi:tRNA pseudouridine55 synthase
VTEGAAAAPHGVLVVDKPQGPTSHDVVSRVRRALGTRAVGHAGTLDPMATGVLVVLVGEAAKLSAYLTADDKRYDATVRLGSETHTLDADGEETATAPVPPVTVADVARALASFLGETQQVAPVVSAIKRDGEALHKRARRGEDVQAPVRAVVLHEAEVLGVDVSDGAATAPARVDLRLRLHVGKGFYVRSLARDLARRLGTVGHLSALRRTASGRFVLGPGATMPTVDGALLEAAARGDGEARDQVRAALVPLTRACDALPNVTLTEAGVRAARTGLPLTAEAFAAEALPDDPGGGRVVVARSPDSAPVALVRPAGDGTFEVARGFVPAAR